MHLVSSSTLSVGGGGDDERGLNLITCSVTAIRWTYAQRRQSWSFAKLSNDPLSYPCRTISTSGLSYKTTYATALFSISVRISVFSHQEVHIFELTCENFHLTGLC